jgi:hypothetical protein
VRAKKDVQDKSRAYLTIVSSHRLRPVPGVSVFQYEELFDRAIAGSLTPQGISDCWVCFDLERASVRNANLLKGLLTRLEDGVLWRSWFGGSTEIGLGFELVHPNYGNRLAFVFDRINDHSRSILTLYHTSNELAQSGRVE